MHRAVTVPVRETARQWLVQVATQQGRSPRRAARLLHLIYMATKSFIIAFTEGLQVELANTGVKIEAL